MAATLALQCFRRRPAPASSSCPKPHRTWRLKAIPQRTGITKLELDRDAPSKRSGNALYLLLLANLGVYAADHWLQLGQVKLLYLYHDMPRWYQFVTATFCHSNWGHLSSNLFFLYIFGKLVEEEEGSLGLWASYLIAGAAANTVSWLLLPPNVVSLGASGAVFGLFAISVLVRLSWDWRKVLEVVILGQFVVDKVVMAAQASTLGYTLSGINHTAHFAGALAGVFLIWLLSKLPIPKSKS